MTEPVTVRRALAQAGLVPVDAQVLLAHIVGESRAWLGAHGDDRLTPQQMAAFFALSKRRHAGEPVAYLTGIREFWGLALKVCPAVLIPRPETETLVELALRHLPLDRAVRVLDLGTGSGAIALAIAKERPQVAMTAIDASDTALAVAHDNARRLGITNVTWLRSDWYAALPPPPAGAAFDLIVSNPPYIAAHDVHLQEGDLRFEPATALTPGADGLTALRCIVTGARRHLRPGGVLAVEQGFDQSDAVQRLFRDAGFAAVGSVRDLAGIARVTHGCGPG